MAFVVFHIQNIDYQVYYRVTMDLYHVNFVINNHYKDKRRFFVIDINRIAWNQHLHILAGNSYINLLNNKEVLVALCDYGTRFYFLSVFRVGAWDNFEVIMTSIRCELSSRQNVWFYNYFWPQCFVVFILSFTMWDNIYQLPIYIFRCISTNTTKFGKKAGQKLFENYLFYLNPCDI